MLRSTGERVSTGRQSLSVEPLRVRNVNDENQRGGGNRFSMGRLSSGMGGGRPSLGTRKSYLPKTSAASASTLSAAQQKPSRRSSGYGRGYGGRSEIAKDPRPISDRGYQLRSIKLLIEFLNENAYPHPISIKLLQSPQSKDFLRIFEFLYSHFDLKYKVGKKPEEEIPSIMKLLGYRFTISKSSMFAIGSPHTWPHLLAALSWLVDLIQICQGTMANVDRLIFPAQDGEFDIMPVSKVKFDYCVRTYEAFLNGKDTYEEEDEAIAAMLQQSALGLVGDMGSLTAENTKLSQELELLEQEPDKVGSLQHKLDVLKTDDQMFVKYLSELEAHNRDQETLLVNSTEDRATVLAELDVVKESNAAMKHIYDTQEFTPADVERIKQRRQELQRQIDAMNREIEKLDSDIWTEEMTIGKTQETIEVKCHEYNKMAQMLKLVPSNAEYARGQDFEMRPSTNFESTIKPALQQLKMQFKERAHETAQMRITALDSLEQIVELVSQKQDDMSMKESKLKRIEDDLQCKKEMCQRELQSITSETELLQEKLVQLQRDGQLSVSEAQKELREVQKENEHIRLRCEKEEIDYGEFLHQITVLVLEHKTLIMNRVEDLLVQAKERLQRVEQSAKYTPMFDLSKPS